MPPSPPPLWETPNAGRRLMGLLYPQPLATRNRAPGPHTHPGLLGDEALLNQFAPSLCNILQQIKHPLLGMFSICFMLILIKESETEQTVPSRWPHKCEISKLFYLPQTLLVNFFKLIPASKSLLISRRKLSNPSLQILALVTVPGANNGWRPPLLHPHPPVPQAHLGTPGAQPLSPEQGSCAHTIELHGQNFNRAVRCPRERPPHSLSPVPPPPSRPLPVPTLPPESGHLTTAHPLAGKNRLGSPGQGLLSSMVQPRKGRRPGKGTPVLARTRTNGHLVHH